MWLYSALTCLVVFDYLGLDYIGFVWVIPIRFDLLVGGFGNCCLSVA